MVRFFLDGAHTRESVACCLDWFASRSLESGSQATRVLLFTCTGYRNPADLLAPIARRTDLSFDVLLFSPSKVTRDKQATSDLSNFSVDADIEERKAAALCDTWSSLRPTVPGERRLSFACIAEAVAWVRALTSANETHVLVTGSLHLVGGVLALLDPEGRSFDPPRE